MAGLSESFTRIARKGLNNLKLWYAAGSGDHEAVSTLLKNGANVHTGNEYPLLVAVDMYCADAQHGLALAERVRVIQTLLDAGANVHARRDGALRRAASSGRTEIAKLLLDAGADIHALSDREMRCLARAYEQDKLAKALIASEPAPKEASASPSLGRR